MQKALYFPNLNGLRFIAAFLVMIHHTEQFKGIFGMTSHFDDHHIYILGKLGVTLFFVLSGFLITYLLLEEKKEFGFISIKEFYIRRILRIWPLYYLVTILGFFILPAFSFFNLPNLVPDGASFLAKLFLFLFMMPNICLALFSPVPYASQLWSVGVEEQFYLFWPWMLNRSKKPLRVLIIIGVAFFSFNFLSDAIRYLDTMFEFFTKETLESTTSLITGIFSMLRIACMATGGITAYILFSKNEKVLGFLFSWSVQLATYLLLAVIYIKGIYLPQEGFSLFFAVIILNIAANPRSLLVLENKIFNFLGKISYGLYMLHSIAIVVAIKLVLSLSNGEGFAGSAAIYIFSALFTIVLATLSYFYFEKRFLNLKDRFAKVKSTN